MVRPAAMLRPARLRSRIAELRCASKSRISEPSSVMKAAPRRCCARPWQASSSVDRRLSEYADIGRRIALARPNRRPAATRRSRNVRLPPRRTGCPRARLPAVCRSVPAGRRAARRRTHTAASKTRPSALFGRGAELHSPAKVDEGVGRQHFDLAAEAKRFGVAANQIGAGKCRSRNSACAAPRLSASSPKAPVPANRSMTYLPATSGPSRLNTASRTRSFIGRVRGSPLYSSLRPRCTPPMIRSTVGGKGARRRSAVAERPARPPRTPAPARIALFGIWFRLSSHDSRRRAPRRQTAKAVRIRNEPRGANPHEIHILIGLGRLAQAYSYPPPPATTLPCDASDHQKPAPKRTAQG